MKFQIEVNQYQLEKIFEAQDELNKKVHYKQDLSNTLSICLRIGIDEFKKIKGTDNDCPPFI